MCECVAVTVAIYHNVHVVCLCISACECWMERREFAYACNTFKWSSSNGSSRNIFTLENPTFTILFLYVSFRHLAIVVVCRNSRFIPLQFAMSVLLHDAWCTTSTINYFVDCWRFNQSKHSLAAAAVAAATVLTIEAYTHTHSVAPTAAVSFSCLFAFFFSIQETRACNRLCAICQGEKRERERDEREKREEKREKESNCVCVMWRWQRRHHITLYVCDAQSSLISISHSS